MHRLTSPKHKVPKVYRATVRAAMDGVRHVVHLAARISVPESIALPEAYHATLLPGFGADRYQRLKPFVTALPVGTKLNVCTAPGIVLDALNALGYEEPTPIQQAAIPPLRDGRDVLAMSGAELRRARCAMQAWR